MPSCACPRQGRRAKAEVTLPDGRAGVYVKCNSHRTRDNLLRALSYKPRAYCSYTADVGQGVYAIALEDWPAVKTRVPSYSQKGLTRFRNVASLFPCWS